MGVMQRRTAAMHQASMVSVETGLRLCARDVFLVLCFSLFLYPISAGGLSVNYSFMLFPLFTVLFSGRLRRPDDTLLLFMACYTLFFVIATMYQYELYYAFPRRVASFVLFMSMFSFVFIRVDGRMIEAFKMAVIIAATYFSLSSIVLFLHMGGSELGFAAKDVVGSQRYGFIYVMGFWLLYLTIPQTGAGRLLRRGVIFVILGGIVLTFSRATIVSLGVSVLIFTVRSLKKPKFSILRLKKWFAFGLWLLIALLLMRTFFDVVFDFFDVRLFEFLSNSGAVQAHLANADTSEGERIFIWENILDYVANNPVTGSGYLGVWILHLFSSGMSGSAHDQYFDLLFRVGIIGFLIHIFLLYRTARYLRFRQLGLYWGFLGVVVYGFFHETFKESQGGFVLAFLFGMMSQTRVKPRGIKPQVAQSSEATA